MLSRPRTWLERIASWGTALAVPLVAVVGFKLLAHARDGALPAAGRADVPAHLAPATATARVLAPPIDASAPPIVELRPSPASGQAPPRPPAAAGEDPRCAALERVIGQSDEESRRAADAATAERLRERAADARAEARTLRCRGR